MEITHTVHSGLFLSNHVVITILGEYVHGGRDMEASARGGLSRIALGISGKPIFTIISLVLIL